MSDYLDEKDVYRAIAHARHLAFNSLVDAASSEDQANEWFITMIIEALVDYFATDTPGYDVVRAAATAIRSNERLGRVGADFRLVPREAAVETEIEEMARRAAL